MHRGLRKLLLIQIVLAASAALAMYAFRGTPAAAGAAVFGGGIALINTLLLARRAVKAADAAGVDARWSGFVLMAGFVERSVFTLVAFGLGIAYWHLDPPSVIVGFALPQAAFMLARQG